VLDPDLVKELLRIRKAFEVISANFPRHVCSNLSKFNEYRLGLPQVAGYYHLNGHPHTKCQHAWNKTEDGLFVDATHTQFDPNAPEVTVIRPPCNILREDIEGWRSMGLHDFQLPLSTLFEVEKILRAKD
jgi:hypothetical protein